MIPKYKIGDWVKTRIHKSANIWEIIEIKITRDDIFYSSGNNYNIGEGLIELASEYDIKNRERILFNNAIKMCKQRLISHRGTVKTYKSYISKEYRLISRHKKMLKALDKKRRIK